MAWTWTYVDAHGSPTDGPGTGTDFPTQSDAESFIGASWPELLAAGVESVTLHEGDREVYGPMSLRPPTA